MENMFVLGTTQYFDPLFEIKHGGNPQDGISQSVRLRRSDLRCLVRTAYSFIFKVGPGTDDSIQVESFWASHLCQGTIWHVMLQIIETLCVDEIINGDVYTNIRALFVKF